MVTLILNDIYVEVDIDYNYVPAIPPRLDGHPDDREPGEDEKWTIYNITTKDGVDLTALLEIPGMTEKVIEEIKDANDI